MSYVDGFVIAVPAGNRDAYRDMAAKAAPIFIEHGATRVVECWGDDVPHGSATDFWGAVKAKDGEIVVFAWIEWPSKQVRDEGQKKVMADPRMAPETMGGVFDPARMIWGGFTPLVDEGTGG